MITHDLNIADVLLEDTVPMGEFFVVQPKGADFDIIGHNLVERPVICSFGADILQRTRHVHSTSALPLQADVNSVSRGMRRAG